MMSGVARRREARALQQLRTTRDTTTRAANCLRAAVRAETREAHGTGHRARTAALMACIGAASGPWTLRTVAAARRRSSGRGRACLQHWMRRQIVKLEKGEAVAARLRSSKQLARRGRVVRREAERSERAARRPQVAS